jgi:steroid 5-alpha reductase family enzyme
MTTSGITRGLLVIAAAYLTALVTAGAWLVWGPATGQLWLDTLIAAILATIVIFVFSRSYGNSSFYDAYWSVVPPLMLLYWWACSAPAVDGLRSSLVTIVVTLWAIRLTANWAYLFPGLHHEDWRYPILRQRAGRWEIIADLFAIHLVPTLEVFLGMVPVYVAVTRPDQGLVWLSWFAFVVGLAAVALESGADRQMRRFVRRAHAGEVMDQGLWSWSRHPNYFGEFGFWAALALFGIATRPADWWWLILGAVAILMMFLGASIPMMEERSLQRRPAYQEVIDRVSRFVPLPPRKVKA